MTRALYSLAAFFLAASLVTGCGTSSTTVTGPSLDRCAITVANSLASVGAAGGSGRLTITAGRECTWSVTSSAPWITPTPPAGGQGDGTADYIVAANPSAEPRRGSVATGGKVLEVVQEGLTCRFDLQPTSQNIGAESGSGSFTVEAASGCNWTPVASENWITITNAGSQSGNGSVNFTVGANTGGARDGNIRVGGQSFTILQASPSCRFQLSAITGTFSGAGGSGTVSVAGPGTCDWTASTTVSWIAIAGGANGTGNGTVSFTVQANSGPARNGILTIGGQRFTVTQQQAECNFSVAPAGQSFSVTGGQGTVTVSTNSVCTWNTSDVPVWVTGMPASGTGRQTIAFTVDANQGPARSAAIIIGGQTFLVSQAAFACSYSINPTSHSAAAAGGASALDVTTAPGCSWTSSGTPAWITGIPASGTGTTTINFNVAANPDPTPRSVNITIAGHTFAVNQTAAACNYSLNPTSYNATVGGGSSSFNVNTTGGCAWTSGGVPAWITGIPANGTGTTNINFTVAANPDPTPRNANITIGGQTFAVTQAAAAACSYSLSSPGYNATAGGGSSAFDVTTTAGCNWTSSGVPAWVTGVPANGMGTTTINFTVAANADPTPRNASITIAGQTFAVTQAAAAAACSYLLNPTSYNAPAGGSSSTFDVNTTAGCVWMSSSPSWISGVPGIGTGTMTVSFTVDANTGPARNGSIVIGGQTFAVSQPNGCVYSTSPGQLTFDASGVPEQYIYVTTQTGCPWTATPSDSWITIVSAGNGAGSETLRIQLQTHAGPATRSGSVTVGGQSVTITQTFP